MSCFTRWYIIAPPIYLYYDLDYEHEVAFENAQSKMILNNEWAKKYFSPLKHSP